MFKGIQRKSRTEKKNVFKGLLLTLLVISKNIYTVKFDLKINQNSENNYDTPVRKLKKRKPKEMFFSLANQPGISFCNIFLKRYLEGV